MIPSPSHSALLWHKIFWQEGVRVLIADDQRSSATTLADMLHRGGHEIVAVVGSGLEAIHAYTGA